MGESFLTDEELLALYKQADTAAFEEFFLRHKRLIYSYLRSRLTFADADEAFQKTFLKIHRHILKYDSSQSALGWVMTIARNVASDFKPKPVTMVTLEEAPEADVSVNDEGAQEARETLELLMKELGPKDRKLFEQRFLHEVSFKEIAKAEGWSVVNTRQKLSRLMRRIRSQLSEGRS